MVKRIYESSNFFKAMSAQEKMGGCYRKPPKIRGTLTYPNPVKDGFAIAAENNFSNRGRKNRKRARSSHKS